MVLAPRDKRSLAALLALFLFTGLVSGGPPIPDKRVSKEVARLFKTEAQIRALPLADVEQRLPELLREGDQPYVIEGQEGISGYVFSTSAKGRYDYFDYSIIYAKDLSVMGIMVTTYRSSHGAEICSKGWLKQFRGYKGEEIRLGKEIDSISGATISASSMVEDMKRCYLLMAELEAAGILN